MYKWSYVTGGIPDEAFIRGKVPMTKAEVRAVIMSKLRLKQDSTLVDVGAGTGSVAIEGALLCPYGKVYALEYKEAALDLIQQNLAHFQVKHVSVLAGRAGALLAEIPYFDRIFIGGSEGETEALIRQAKKRLPQEGRIVLSAVALETAAKAMTLLKQYQFQEIEAITLQVSRGKSAGAYTLMEGMNPITILSALQGEPNIEGDPAPNQQDRSEQP